MLFSSANCSTARAVASKLIGLSGITVFRSSCRNRLLLLRHKERRKLFDQCINLLHGLAHRRTVAVGIVGGLPGEEGFRVRRPLMKQRVEAWQRTDRDLVEDVALASGPVMQTSGCRGEFDRKFEPIAAAPG